MKSENPRFHIRILCTVLSLALRVFKCSDMQWLFCNLNNDQARILNTICDFQVRKVRKSNLCSSKSFKNKIQDCNEPAWYFLLGDL